MFNSKCCFLTCTQVSQEAGQVVWYSHLLKDFPQFVVTHTVRGINAINEAEVDVFLEFSCFFYNPICVGNLISGSPAFSKSSLNMWEFLGHVLLKPRLENFEHYFVSVWDERNCVVVWTFFGIAFLWDWNKNWPFPVLWPLLSFPNLLAYWCRTLTVSCFRIWNSSTGISSPLLAWFVVILPNSVLFSHSVLSDSFWPHGLQHPRPPCPSSTPGAYSNSCHPTHALSPPLSTSLTRMVRIFF